MARIGGLGLRISLLNLWYVLRIVGRCWATVVESKVPLDHACWKNVASKYIFSIESKTFFVQSGNYTKIYRASRVEGGVLNDRIA